MANGLPGRPSSYSDEIADKICDQIADGIGLAIVCQQDGFPDHKTVRGWILANLNGFFSKYARAKDFGMDYQAETMMQVIENEVDVQRARLKVDTMKWYISKIAPKKYGDKIELTHTNSPIEALNEAQLRERLAGLVNGTESSATDRSDPNS